MWGAIIGDVAGSYYEVKEMNAFLNKGKVKYEDRVKILNKDKPLFTENSFYTDDTALTCAIADAILNNDKDYGKYLKIYGKAELSLGKDKFGRQRFSKGFIDWLNGKTLGNSFGNGCAMRISPIGLYFDTLEDVINNAILATVPSHNNLDAKKSAIAVAGSIFLAKKGSTKDEIKKFAEKTLELDINFNLEDLQRDYRFEIKAINSVPQAIFCFLNSDSFEDCLRKSISIGGDSDTIACVACSIAESYYDIPSNIKEQVIPYIPNQMQKVINDFYTMIKN